jgi:hypothetical protein
VVIVRIVRSVGSVGRVGSERERRVSRAIEQQSNRATERTVDARPSILRTRLVPSKSIRRYKFTETAEENKVEQATVRF